MTTKKKERAEAEPLPEGFIHVYRRSALDKGERVECVLHQRDFNARTWALIDEDGEPIIDPDEDALDGADAAATAKIGELEEDNAALAGEVKSLRAQVEAITATKNDLEAELKKERAAAAARAKADEDAAKAAAAKPDGKK